MTNPRPPVRPLSLIQRSVLKALAERGYWFPGCGWIWQNVSQTTRHMQSLERRGLAQSSDVPYPKGIATTSAPSYRRWDITAAGRDEARR